jgi:hypothetical protein
VPADVITQNAHLKEGRKSGAGRVGAANRVATQRCWKVGRRGWSRRIVLLESGAKREARRIVLLQSGAGKRGEERGAANRVATQRCWKVGRRGWARRIVLLESGAKREARRIVLLQSGAGKRGEERGAANRVATQRCWKAGRGGWARRIVLLESGAGKRGGEGGRGESCCWKAGLESVAGKRGAANRVDGKIAEGRTHRTTHESHNYVCRV